LATVEAKRTAADEQRAESLVDRLEGLIRKIEDLVDQAHASGAAGQLLAAARELRACWELQAKLSGELSDRPQVTVNLLSSPEVGSLVQVLLHALAPYPAARIAAANALDVIDAQLLE
jgi:hypothetical protein